MFTSLHYVEIVHLSLFITIFAHSGRKQRLVYLQFMFSALLLIILSPLCSTPTAMQLGVPFFKFNLASEPTAGQMPLFPSSLLKI